MFSFVSGMAEKRIQNRLLIFAHFWAWSSPPSLWFLGWLFQQQPWFECRHCILFCLFNKPLKIHDGFYLCINLAPLNLQKQKGHGFACVQATVLQLPFWFYVDPYAFAWTSICSCLLPLKGCVDLLLLISLDIKSQVVLYSWYYWLTVSKCRMLLIDVVIIPWCFCFRLMLDALLRPLCDLFDSKAESFLIFNGGLIVNLCVILQVLIF